MAELQRAALAAYDKIMREKDEVTSLDMFIAGRDWQKERMMKDAIGGCVVETMNFDGSIKRRYVETDFLPFNNDYYGGQEVKVIIIKSE